MMSVLHYQDSQLLIESVNLQKIAEQFGTPCYVYSRAAIEANWRAFDEAFRDIPHRICYAVKANSNLAILHLLAGLSSGFDIVSGGELARVLAAGGDPSKVVFSGVGKSIQEMQRAIDAGIYCFDVESEPELKRLQTLAASKNTVVNVALRVNPDVNPNTHAHISTGLKENKFGIELSEIVPMCSQIRTMSGLHLIGLACHIGSQVTSLEPFFMALDQLLTIQKQLESLNIPLKHLNLGGGLGIHYHSEQPPSVRDYAEGLKQRLQSFKGELILEPGRAIIGNTGILLTRVEYLKHSRHKNFAIVDAGMNDLLRPALYDAWQAILPVIQRDTNKQAYDIAGPVCESADYLGKNRSLSLQEGDLLAIDTAGAYGFSMSSNYNSRCRPAEVLVEADTVRLIRARESIQDLFASESI